LIHNASKIILVCVSLCLANVSLADDNDNIQTSPGHVTGAPGQVETYQPAAPQSAAPQAPSQVPSYQDPNADIEVNPSAQHRGMEECRVVAQNGVGMIKAYVADSGMNRAGDPYAWIWVPSGVCARLNAGDYSNIPPEILDKINY
jgi:hypothetical protein